MPENADAQPRCNRVIASPARYDRWTLILKLRVHSQEGRHYQNQDLRHDWSAHWRIGQSEITETAIYMSSGANPFAQTGVSPFPAGEFPVDSEFTVSQSFH